MATNQRLAAHDLGFTPPTPNNGISTVNLNNSSANLKLAWSVVLDSAKTLNEVSLYCSGVTGTVDGSNLNLDIFSDSSGTPGSSLTSGVGVTLSAGSISAGNWQRFSGLSVALSADTQYWAVVINNQGTPASNFPTYRFGGNGTGTLPGGTASGLFGHQKMQYNGSSWVSQTIPTCVVRFGFSDSSYWGLPATTSTLSSDLVYFAREAGMKLTMPTGCTFNIRGLVFWLKKLGSPAGNLRYRLYTGSSSTPTLLATTNALGPSDVNTSAGYIPLHFSSDQAIAGGTVIRVTWGTTTGGDSSNYYADPNEYTWDSDSNSLTLTPFAGTAGKTYTTDGVTFTDTNTGVHPFTMLLDTDGEFLGQGGTPRPIVARATSVNL
jgi:hypothetical protein